MDDSLAVIGIPSTVHRLDETNEMKGVRYPILSAKS